MPEFTQDMKDIMLNSKTFILSTADKNGKPNGVPVGAKIVSDDEILIVDYMMCKTRFNIAENPVAAVTAWGNEHYGYQFKGRARVETAGEFFDKALEMNKSNDGELILTVRAAVIIKIDEVYYIGIKDSSKNLF